MTQTDSDNVSVVEVHSFRDVRHGLCHAVYLVEGNVTQWDGVGL